MLAIDLCAQKVGLQADPSLGLQGIKVVDAESKQKARQLLAEQGLSSMDLDDWEEVPDQS